MLGNTEIKAFPQPELLSLCYPQACNTATLFPPTGHRGGGRKDGGGEGVLHCGSVPITQRTPGHVLHGVARKGAAAQIWSLLPSLPSFGSYKEWPHLTKDPSDSDSGQTAA